MTPPKKHGLGRGLSGLISGSKMAASVALPVKKPVAVPAKSTPAPAENTASPFRQIPPSKIEPSDHQARREFDEQSLKELAESIRCEGLLQPLVVRQKGDKYQLVAGERRWRAVKQLGLKTVPVLVVQASESSSAVMGLIENLQRRDLNPIETALGHASLMKDFSLTQEAVAERLAQPRATIANTLRLLSLEREIQNFITKGQLSVGHAKVLLGLEKQLQTAAARKVIEDALSVRETEILIAKLKRDSGKKITKSTPAQAQSAVIEDLEKRLSGKLNTRVALKHSPKHGKIIIDYFGNEDLQRILEKLGLA